MKDNGKIGFIIAGCAFVIMILAFRFSPGNVIYDAKGWRVIVASLFWILGTAEMIAYDKGIIGRKGNFVMWKALVLCAALWIIGFLFIWLGVSNMAQ